MRVRTVALTALTAIVACAPPAPRSSDAATYQQLTADLSGAVAAYRASAAAMKAPADCFALLQQYMARATPDVDGMQPIAGRMDGEIAAAGRTMDSDLACGMDVIAAELARHAGMACVSPDLAGDTAEAARHCDAMETYLDHMEMRSAELSQVMGAGMMATVDGGFRMTDGGWMGWGHEMPGCSFADGGYSMMDAGMMDAGMMDAGMPGADGGTAGMDGGHMDGGPMMDGGMR